MQPTGPASPLRYVRDDKEHTNCHPAQGRKTAVAGPVVHRLNHRIVALGLAFRCLRRQTTLRDDSLYLL